MAVRRLDGAPICRSGSATRSCGRERSDSSPVSSKRALLAREQAREEAHERPGVAAVDRLLRRAQAAQTRAVDANASTSSSSTSTPSARTAAIADSVSPARPKPRMTLSPSATAREQDGALRDRP